MLNQSERNIRIAEIVADHVNMKSLSILKEGIRFPVEKKVLHEHLRSSCEKGGHINVLTSKLMKDLRENDLVSVCPNNGLRRVPVMQAWDSWVKDGNEEGSHPRHRHHLFSSPAFDELNTCLFQRMSLYCLGMEKSLGSDEILQEVDFDSILSNVIDETTATLTGHPPARISVNDYHCQLSGERVWCSDDPLNPVLTYIDSQSRAFEILPIIRTVPKMARHLILELPSRELLMTNQFVIKGFREGLAALTGRDDDYNINYPKGIDECMRDCIEKAGLAVVHMHESWPNAYAAGDGIWRMSRIDSGHDIFLSDGKCTDVEIPQPAWSFDTGPSVNHLADTETVIDILMASGLYDTRELAHEALDANMMEYDIARIPMPDIECLHIYVPTGHGVYRESFEDRFRAEEIEYTDWQKDSYVISASHLTVSPKLLEIDVWCCLFEDDV